MNDPLVIVSRKEAVAIITLNRPDRLNALSHALRVALVDAIGAADADAVVRAIVLIGAGDRAFSAGLDLKELGEDTGSVFASDAFADRANPVAAIVACSKPVIGAINGVAITGGLEVALACDIRICSETARFADTHVKVEVVPGWGLSQRLSRIVGGSRAKEMSLTGMFVDASTALAWGLVNRVMAQDELLTEAVRIGGAIAEHAPAMVARYKALIDTGLGMTFADAMAHEKAQSSAFNGSIGGGSIGGRYEGVRTSNRS